MTSRYGDDEVLTYRGDHDVERALGKHGASPRPLDAQQFACDRLAGHGHLTVELESLAAEGGKQLADRASQQLIAVSLDQRAIRVVRVLVAEVDDLTTIVVNG